MLDKNIQIDRKTILITGCAGFIGAALANDILTTVKNIHIIGVDSMNDYYDVALKEYRLNTIVKNQYILSGKFTFFKGNIADKKFIEKIFEQYKPDMVINLAAQAGVRYSVTNSSAYIESNLVGFFNILEACRNSYNDGNKGVEHLIFASSSSVYGNSKKIPYSIEDRTNHPASLYAATKMADELLAYAYAKLYGIPTTGLRFFTVYGPAGRPDMAYFDFANKLIAGESIRIFNYGKCERDFTFIDDVITGIKLVMSCSPMENEELVRYKVYNIGHNSPVNLLVFVQILCDELKKLNILPPDYDIELHREFVEMQPGDVEVTYADVSELERDFGYKPLTDLSQGLHEFGKWYSKIYLPIIKEGQTGERK